jgi:hypothetical protein
MLIETGIWYQDINWERAEALIHDEWGAVDYIYMSSKNGRIVVHEIL